MYHIGIITVFVEVVVVVADFSVRCLVEMKWESLGPSA